MDGLQIELSDASGVPFYRQIVDQLSDLIRSGRLEPGFRLPSVRRLSADLLVSLITVRRAYADLEAAGLLQRRQGQGTFVAEGVDEAARRKALEEGRAGLGDAVKRARTLGLSDSEIREAVDAALGEEEVGHG